MLVGCAAGPNQASAPAPRVAKKEHREVTEQQAAPVADTLPEQIVLSKFETSAFALRPGSKFWLVARFAIHQGYRISWKNPGDVGKPTVARFRAPEGFEVGEVMYPRPERFVLNGEFVSYGYQGETALFAEVDVPQGLSDQVPYRFELEAEWFACKKQCAAERTQAFFELLVDPSAPRTAMEESLSSLLESVPQPVSELGRAEHRWQEQGNETLLSLSAPKVEWLDFYPGGRELPRLLRVDGSKEALRLSFEAPSEPPETVKGIAIARVDGIEQSFAVELPWGK